LEKRERLREYEGSSSRIQGKDECRSEMIREIEYERRKRL